jgi:hypothetical protein
MWSGRVPSGNRPHAYLASHAAMRSAGAPPFKTFRKNRVILQFMMRTAGPHGLASALGKRMMALRTEPGGRASALVVFIAGWTLYACGGMAFSVTGDAGSGDSSGSASSGAGSGGHSGTSASGSHDGGSSSGSGAGSGGSGAAGASGSSAGATGSSGSPPDAAGPIACQLIEPNAGQPCSKPGLQCEYGISPDIRCNQVAVCEAAGWTYLAAPKCPAAMCPLTYEEIVAGNHCQVPEETCAYPKGTCICSEDTGGPVRLVDAAVVTSWVCFDSTLACRSPRPNLGDSCADEGRKCDYGACNGGVALLCTDGLWQEDPSGPVCAQAN